MLSIIFGVALGLVIGITFTLNWFVRAIRTNREFHDLIMEDVELVESEITSESNFDTVLTAEQHGSQWYLYENNQFVSQGISVENALEQVIDRWKNNARIKIIKSDSI